MIVVTVLSMGKEMHQMDHYLSSIRNFNFNRFIASVVDRTIDGINSQYTTRLIIRNIVADNDDNGTYGQEVERKEIIVDVLGRLLPSIRRKIAWEGITRLEDVLVLENQLIIYHQR
jgi:hypothetical protein